MCCCSLTNLYFWQSGGAEVVQLNANGFQFDESGPNGCSKLKLTIIVSGVRHGPYCSPRGRVLPQFMI